MLDEQDRVEDGRRLVLLLVQKSDDGALLVSGWKSRTFGLDGKLWSDPRSYL